MPAVGLLYDAQGRVIIAGQVASDAVGQGNPLLAGGVVDNTSPAAAAEGDARVFRAAPEGEQIVVWSRGVGAIGDGTSETAIITTEHHDNTSANLALESWLKALAPDGFHDRVRTLGDTAGAGLGVLAAAPWIPGATDAITIMLRTVSDSTTRVTVVTPTSGTKIRIISVFFRSTSATSSDLEVYFAAGAGIITTVAKAILGGIMGRTGSDFHALLFAAWPDGGGPVGAVNDVLSLRTSVNITTEGQLIVVYREE